MFASNEERILRWLRNIRILPLRTHPLKILTNFESGKSWPNTTYIRGAWDLFKVRKHHDLAILADSARESSIFCLFQFFSFHRTPVFLYECLWDEPSSKWAAIYHKFLRWVYSHMVVGYAVFSECDRKRYSDVFGVPLDKMVYIPYCTTLKGFDFNVEDKGYIFSGGNSNRDYKVLFRAMFKPCPRVVVATSLSLIKAPAWEHIEIKSVNEKEFRKLMAESSIVVMPLTKGKTRSVGHQSYLNAMAMGKPVIVTDRDGAKDYIEDGVDGFLIDVIDEYGKPNNLRQKIEELMENPELRKRIGDAAKKKAENFTGALHMERTYESAIRAYCNGLP